VWRTLRSLLFPVWCAGCGAPDVALCPSCAAGARITALMAGPDLYVEAAASYGGLVRDAVLAMKRGERAPLDPLAALVAPLVPAGAVLIPAVTSRRRSAERGFDQSRELARRIAAIRGVTVADVLRKRGAPQRGSGRAERLAAAGRFVVRRGVALPPAGILVDDVLTTGATLRDAAATLERAGVAVRRAVVAAYAPPRETSRGGAESDGT
jgi:predicted amidophosphoribosyltransferase